MTFANVGTLGTQSGQLDAVVAILTRPNPALAEAGCLLYEVGTSEGSSEMSGFQYDVAGSPLRD